MRRPGEHQLEMQQIHDGGQWTGAKIQIASPDDAGFSPELSPF